MNETSEAFAIPPRNLVTEWRAADQSRPRWVLSVLGVFLALTAFFSLGVGAVKISPEKIISILGVAVNLNMPVIFDEQEAAVLGAIRLPRILCACIVGASLGVAGAAMQGLFRNPLADPGLIGVSSGAALGAVLMIVLGSFLPWKISSVWTLPIAAFLGAWLVVWIVHHLSLNEGRASIPTLLLAGIALNALCGAGIGLLSYIASDAQLRSITFWSMGSVGGATWEALGVLIPILVVAFCGLFARRRILNALLMGEAEATHMGFDVESEKRWIVLLCTLIVGATVSIVGMIGFIGLIVPHLLRLWIGADHRYLLAGSAMLGGLLLLVADLVARVIVMPAELPIGIVTALFGAPFFIFLLRKQIGKNQA